MNISDRDIETTISFIVRLFNDSVQGDSSLIYFRDRQSAYFNQLQGLNLLFSDNVKITRLIASASSQIKDTPYQSADACRSPVQSADVVGQGSTSDLSVDSGN